MNDVDATGPAMEDSVTHLVADWKREYPEFDTLPIGVLARIHRLSNHLGQATRRWLDAEGLTWEAFSLIVTLRRQGAPYALRPTDILRESLLTSGAVSNRIDRVEKLGLVERRPSPDDGRATIVQLTPEGLRAADAAIQVHVAHLQEIFGPVGVSELMKLDALLARTLSGLEAAAEAGSQG